MKEKEPKLCLPLKDMKKATADQEEHDKKLKEQQKELIRSHELTIQQQEES